MTKIWDVDRDGEWALKSLVRAVENGSGSESVGCRIYRTVGGDVVLQGEFAALLVAAIEKAREDERVDAFKRYEM